MIKFDIIYSSPLTNLTSTSVDQGFLTSVTNWEYGSTRDICGRMPKVDHICRVITRHLRLKARPWQVNVLIDITHNKRDVYVIASTNIGMSLVYQAIPIVTRGLVFVISSIIAPMEDQVRALS